MPAQIDDYTSKLKEHYEKLHQISFQISSLDLTGVPDLLVALGTISDFDTLFGFGGVFRTYIGNLRIDQNPTDPNFAVALRNIFCRRTFFYLLKLQEECDPAETNKNLKLLLMDFKKYRRLEAYGFDKESQYLSAVKNEQPYALAPLYESFVDSELFTTLLYIERYFGTRSTKWKGTMNWKGSNSHKEIWLKKLEGILNEYITNDYTLQQSVTYKNNIQDESNIVWGIRLLHDLQKQHFSLGGRFRGNDGFVKLLLHISSRPSDMRIFPKQEDLVLEITPELRTLERTNLYVAFNLIQCLPTLKAKNQERQEILAIINSILTECVLNPAISGNLYFLCLKYRCLQDFIKLLPDQPRKSDLSKEVQRSRVDPVVGSIPQDFADIGIITVVPPETDAVRNILSQCKRREGKRTTRVFYTGNVPGPGGHRWRVALTQQLEKGNRSTIMAFNDLIKEFDPHILILFGIAGGIHKDLALCDVVVASQVIFYDKRKEKNGWTYHRGESEKIPAKMLSVVNDFFVQNGEKPDMTSHPTSFKQSFNVFLGPIGSGEVVVADKLSEIRAWLHQFNDQTLAVETESGGFSQAFFENALAREQKLDKTLVVRGISDHADFDKADKWRIPASHNAAKVLVDLLSLIPTAKKRIQ